MAIHDLETAWRVYILLEATGWKWPPSVLLNESEALLDDVLTVASVAQRLKEALKGR